ncbi:GTPase Era, mitochondrial [Thelohanellus kitauei]|uniref:GTPase Era, mitochondrial n=1 Tax=Thelohanellus kitauei TaxID=669202 RepID=A0A0C2JQ87_THEKT|nr:GTPase Era, mitochondrial [Thelohanellus kitauei]
MFKTACSQHLTCFIGFSSIFKNTLNKYSTECQRTIKVGFIGRPNAGKSSLINSCIGRHFLPVSNIPHTSQQLLTCVKTFTDTQVIFQDTPGLINPAIRKKRFRIDEKLDIVRDCLSQSDLIAVVVDSHISITYPYISPEIQMILREYENLPSVLLLNKVDTIQRKKIKCLAKSLTRPPLDVPMHLCKTPIDTGGWDRSKAKECEGILKFIYYVCSISKYNPWPYEPETAITFGLDVLTTELTKEALLHVTRNEIPFVVTPETTITFQDATMIFRILIRCPSERYIRILKIEEGRLRDHIDKHFRNELKSIKYSIEIMYAS